ncbi:UNVERIFIED_CONTAM: hypothetical protein FKN15_068198 [Acipenser sinensis]
MNSVDVLKLGVDALKEELQRRRLDTRGPRTELTKRLQDALEGEASAEETDEEWDDYSEAEVKVVVKEEEEEEECEPVPVTVTVTDPRCRLEEGRPPPASRKRALEEGPGRGAHCEKLQHKRTPPQLLDLDSGDWTYGTRKPNFTESETRVLMEEILRNRHTLFSPDSWRPPPQERQRCWGEIREAVNAVSEVSREVKELKRRSQILKKKMKDRLGGEQDGRELRLCGWEESIVGFLKDEVTECGFGSLTGSQARPPSDTDSAPERLYVESSSLSPCLPESFQPLTFINEGGKVLPTVCSPKPAALSPGPTHRQPETKPEAPSGGKQAEVASIPTGVPLTKQPPAPEEPPRAAEALGSQATLMREWREQQTQHVALLGSLSQQVCSAVQHIADMANTFKSMAAVAQSVLSLASNTEATQQQEETDDKPRQT